MFAIDGVKLPSNASKQKSGTRADFEHQATKLETAARVMLERHREEDSKPIEADLRAKEALRITRLKTDAAQLRQWLTDHPEDRKGSKGTIRKSKQERSLEIEAIRSALIDGENSGKPQPFDPLAFKKRMTAQNG